MTNRTRLTGRWLAVGLLCVAAAASPAADPEGVPGELDVLQGTAIQLGSTTREDDRGPQPTSYEWRIVEGEGGELLHPGEPRAIFRAPAIGDDVERFVIELTARYPSGEESRARVHIRAHHKSPESPTSFITDNYQRAGITPGGVKSKPAPRLTARDIASYASYYPSWYSGYGWGWGSFVNYPVYVPVMIPPPGVIWGPGMGVWVDPSPIPYGDMVTAFPERIAGEYVPQDYPGDDRSHDAHRGSFDTRSVFTPTDEPPEIDPSDAPMIDAGFDADPFGW